MELSRLKGKEKSKKIYKNKSVELKSFMTVTVFTSTLPGKLISLAPDALK